MIKNRKYDVYTYSGSTDQRFISLMELFRGYIRNDQLIEWFYSDQLYFTGSSYVGIDKRGDFIEIQNLPSEYFDETDPETEELLNQKFIMTKQNFAKIIHQWDELRITRPDIILVIIHEDNHVSLETDPIIIKEYQDAGYAFDINKQM